MKSIDVADISWKIMRHELNTHGEVRIVGSSKSIRKLMEIFAKISIAFSKSEPEKNINAFSAIYFYFRVVMSAIARGKIYNLALLFILEAPTFVAESDESIVLARTG